MSEGGDNLTYENLVIEVLQLIDEYSRKGVVLTVAKTADYRMKIPAAVNWVQQDLANSQKGCMAIIQQPQHPQAFRRLVKIKNAMRLLGSFHIRRRTLSQQYLRENKV